MRLRCFPSDRIHSLALIVIIACGMALAAAVSAFAQEAEAVGQVVRQRGAVTALHGVVPRALHLGASVYAGDRVATGADAKVEIEFRDTSTLAVGPDTEVEVSDYATDRPGRGILTLLLGIIRTGLSDVWDDGFEVRTRAAVASVRSTDWITEAQEDRSSVFVVAGTVEVTGLSDGTRVILEQGFGTDILAGGAPSAPKQWGASRVEQALARTRLP